MRTTREYNGNMKKYKNRFCCGRKKTMNQEKKIRLLLVPLIFIVLLYVPAMGLDIVPSVFFLGGGMRTWNPCVLILFISMWLWCALFYYMPVGVYIAMLVVYTVVSWRWILRQKRGNAMYFIVWLVLCVVSILMYWRWGSEFSIMIRQ